MRIAGRYVHLDAFATRQLRTRPISECRGSAPHVHNGVEDPPTQDLHKLGLRVRVLQVHPAKNTSTGDRDVVLNEWADAQLVVRGRAPCF